jgi:hypothetical protein
MESLRIDIDRYRLDDEWIGQAKQYLTHSEKLAEARLWFDTAKTELDLIKAELDQKIRDDPVQFGLPKVTETAVQNAVLLQPEHKAAAEKLNRSRYEMGVIQAAVDALEHRKRALENLVQLHGMQYFAEPKAPPEMKEEIDHAQKRKIRSRWLESND